MMLVYQKNKIILFLLLDGDMIKPLKNNIGLLEIHGVNIGEN